MLDRTAGRRARLRYLPGGHEVVEPGDHVVCAVTGQRIPLDELRYWSHELQEAYADVGAASRRHRQARAEGRLP